MDTFSPQERSAVMRKVKGKDTTPEMIVRRLIHKHGFRYRLHRNDIPGCPDLVFPARKKIIFVHGCFWHVHGGCKRARIPKSNREYWMKKLTSNKERDKKNSAELSRSGWDVLVIWECEVKAENLDKLRSKIIDFLKA